jgi:hypothetical protein
MSPAPEVAGARSAERFVQLVAVGAVAHLVAHIVDRHAGGQPVVDIPAFGLVAGLLVAAAIVRARLVRA